MTKNMMVKALSDFMASKGVEYMTLAEYKAEGNDVPVKDYLLRRTFGSWNRVMAVAKHRFPIEVPVVVVGSCRNSETKGKKSGEKIMEKIFHWSSTFKNLGETDDGGLDIKGSASTNALDRAGDIINADAWTKGGLDNFKNNPIILFNHNYNKPIGRAKDLL